MLCTWIISCVNSSFIDFCYHSFFFFLEIWSFFFEWFLIWLCLFCVWCCILIFYIRLCDNVLFRSFFMYIGVILIFYLFPQAWLYLYGPTFIFLFQESIFILCIYSSQIYWLEQKKTIPCVTYVVKMLISHAYLE